MQLIASPGFRAYVANAVRLAEEALADVLTPPPSIDYLAFAEDNIVFTKRESPLPGPYNRAQFPFFDEILQALSPDDPCRIVTLAKSAQLGGTVLANIFTLGSMILDAADFLYVHPTEDNASRWSKLKLAPMIRGLPAAKRLFPEKSRDGSNSVLFKERVDKKGAIQISGANSPASLSQVSMPRQVQDDLAKWDMNAAGDPETQADSRSWGYEFAKIFKLSTPLIWPGCRITKSFEAGSQEYPEVPCPHCDAFQVLEWSNMLAQVDEDAPEKAHFTCTECGCEIHEHHRPAMLRRLKWVARNPKMKRQHRSFWLWCAYSPLQSWEGIARRWIAAKGDAASEQAFMNDVAGLAYRTTGEAVDWEVLRDRGSESHYSRGQIPAGGLIITIGVDCQGDRVEWQVIAWGRDRRRWIVDAGVFPGHIGDLKARRSLDALLEQSWPNVFGRKIAADMLAIDGNAWTEDVWDWAKGHPAGRVIMVRGANSEHAPLLARVKKERDNKGRLLKYARRFYNFGTSALKLALYRNLAKTDPEERAFIGLPRGLDDDFYRQLTAERRKPVKRKDGFTVFQWIKDAAQANEMLDTHLQAEAAAIRIGVRSMPDAVWDEWEAARDTAPPVGQLDLEDLMRPPPVDAHAVRPDEPAPAPTPQPEPEPEPETGDWLQVPQEDWING
ncbi:Phage terminase large subunit [compost metagenome]